MDDECSELENDVWADINDKLIRAERRGEKLVLVAVREAVKATAAREQERILSALAGDANDIGQVWLTGNLVRTVFPDSASVRAS